MKSMLISDYFINEYLLLNKDISKNDILDNFLKSTPVILNYTFKNPELLLEAFTHKSFAHEITIELTNNEKLEFLGDSVLQMVISETIFKKYPELNEGQLSKLRSAIVNEETLAKLALFFKFEKTLLIGKGELKTKGYERPSLLANAFEAYLGAIFLDSDYQTSKAILLEAIDIYKKESKNDIFSLKISENHDAKSKLQEIVMELYKVNPEYESEELQKKNTKEKFFKVHFKIKDQVIASEENLSKKKAMQLLAQKILNNELYKNL